MTHTSPSRTERTVNDQQQYYEAYWEAGHVADSEHQRWKVRVLKDLHARLAPTNVLDVGAGDGAVLAQTAPTSVRRVGTELSSDALAKLRARGLEGARVDLEAEQLPFEDGSFDFVCCLDVLEHVFTPDRVAGELARVVHPTGHVAVCVPNAFNLANRVLFGLGRHVDVMDVAHHSGAPFSEHIRFFSEPILDGLLARAGLCVIERHRYFPRNFSDPRVARFSWLASAVTLPSLHERLPSLFALGFLVVCRRA